MSKIKIKISHSDPKIEKQGAKAVLDFVKAISKLTGEKIKIIKIEDENKNEKIKQY